MTSAAVLFYGRRSRTSRSFDDLGLGSLAPSPLSSSSSSSSSSNFSSSSSDSNNSSNHRHRHHHRRGDLHRRHRHINFDVPDKCRQSANVLHPSPRSPVAGIEPHQGCSDESPSRDINNRETVHGLSGRYFRNNNRLPGSVLLAKERLVQRLRGVSVTGNRENRETSPSLSSDHLWVVDADWETSVSGEQPAAFTDLYESPAGAHQQSEQLTKPLGLTRDALSQLHHEVFMEQQNAATVPTSQASNECSICLESFMEGNKLVNLPCGHRFHTSCLYPWLQTCGECPYCRSCIMLN